MPEGNTPSTPGTKSNKMWYIIGGIVVVLLVGGFLSRGIGDAAFMAAGDRPNLDGSATYTDNSGNSVTVGSGSMPASWPTDAPQNYAGATIQYSGNSNPQTGKAGSAVAYTTKATAQAVVDYYKAQLSAKGWVIAGTANTGAATVLSATKDARSFGVYIVDAGGGNVSVTAGIGM